MKIAYIIPTFPAPTETFAVSDVNALVRDGHDVKVHTLRAETRQSRNLRSVIGLDPAVRVSSPSRQFTAGSLKATTQEPAATTETLMRALRILPGSLSLAATVAAIAPRVSQIVAEIRTDRPDVVHAFWGRHPSLVLAALRRQTPQQALLSVFVGAYDLVADDALVHLGLTSANVHFTHSSANREFFEHNGIQTFHVIKRGIPTTELTPSPKPRDPKKIFTASALDPRKNISAAIRAFALAARTDQDLTFDIAGSGPQLAELQKLADDLKVGSRVTFLGYISRAEVFRRMSEAAIFLFLSNKSSERSPNVIKEALWAGCYVISSRTPGIEDLIESPSIGSIINATDIGSACREIQKTLLETKEMADRRRALARELIEMKWSARENMREYVRIWQNRAQSL